MFQGYTQGTFEFFMALRFNNNTEFFHDNHDWYVRDLRAPSLELAAALSDTVEDIDPELERRPNRVVSRINRDVRYSRDKTPYRDYLWLAFRPPHERHEDTMSLYFDISDRGGANCGIGFYNENRPMMNALRRELLARPDALRAVWEPVRARFSLYVKAYRRITIPDTVPEDLRTIYAAKGFYFEHHFEDERIVCSPALADEVNEAFRQLKPLYRYLRALMPTEDADTTKTADGARSDTEPAENARK